MQNITELSEKFYKEYINTKQKADYFSKKDFQNDGIVNFLFSFCVLLVITGISLTFIKEKISLEYRIYGNFILYAISLIVGTIICIRGKIRFYKAEEIVENFDNVYKSKFYELRYKAIDHAQDEIKKKNDIIDSLQKEYDVKKKELNEEDLKERISYAEKEIAKKEKELETATYKYVLSDKSYNVRSKKDMILNILQNSMITFIISFMLLALPCLMTTDKTGNIKYATMTLFIALIFGGIFAIIYTWIKFQNLKAFYLLNNCELPDKPEYFECLDLKNEMNKASELYQSYLEIAYSFSQKYE